MSESFPQPSEDHEHSLACCFKCGDDKMQMIDGYSLTDRDDPDDVFFVKMRCGNCEDETEQTASQSSVEDYDTTHDQGMRSIYADAELMSRARLRDETESFVSAIHHGYILPEDF